MFQMELNYFTVDTSFPFFIQYGFHEEDLYLHSHKNFSELVIVLNGSATHIVNNEEFYISKGDVFIIGADTAHGYRDAHDFHICNLMFQPDFFFSNDCDIKKAPGFQGLFVIEPILSQKTSFQNRLKLDIYNYEMIQKTINMMIKEYTSQPIGFKTLLTGSFYSLAVLLSRLYSKSEKHIDNEIIGMAKSIAYIEAHYMEDLTLNELAKIASFSPRHFSRRFYEIKQTTPIQYIQTLRLEKASYYLRNTQLPISEVAAQCGFSDSNYFSRSFKKHYAITLIQFHKKTYSKT